MAIFLPQHYAYIYFRANHTESLQLEYNPKVTDYRKLLDIFWTNHNPAAINRPQYMSAIFYHDNEQKDLAEKTMAEHQNTLARKIQTQILPADVFYDAEG